MEGSSGMKGRGKEGKKQCGGTRGRERKKTVQAPNIEDADRHI